MYRSSSATRVSDEYFASTSPSSLGVDQLLPTYNPPLQASRREKTRIRSADNIIHLIPLLLLLCTIILWFFSSPVNLVSKGDHPLVRVTSLVTRDVNSDVFKGVVNDSRILSEDNSGRSDLNDRSEDNDLAN